MISLKDISLSGGRGSLKSEVFIIGLLLTVITLSTYWSVGQFKFLTYDDPHYVYKNRHVVQGFTPESIGWAFTTTYRSNWHPLTWLSHMLDVQIFGVDPGPHHLVNLFLHIMNTLLLLVVLTGMTRALWRSALVATLFALHPLHVESVAWISERKDLVSAFFWMLTMGGYLLYVGKRSAVRYLLVAVPFMLGLLAKPMIVTLPFVLILLDFWPLNRMASWPAGSRGISFIHLMIEKIPLLLLAAVSSIVTVAAQRAGGAMSSTEFLPPAIRVTNAIMGYVWYLEKMVWPRNLNFLYIHPRGFPQLWKLFGAFVLITLVFFLAVRFARKVPWLPVGYFWYMGTLVPVIGLIQVGIQATADRYSYIPLIGVFIILSWGIGDIVSRWPNLRSAAILMALAALSALAVATHYQVSYWRNGVVLFSRAVAIDGKNWVAYDNLGETYENTGRLPKAVEAYTQVLHLRPGSAKAHYNMGLAYSKMGARREAMVEYQSAIRLDPRYQPAYFSLGMLYLELGNLQGAWSQYYRLQKLNPGRAAELRKFIIFRSKMRR